MYFYSRMQNIRVSAINQMYRQLLINSIRNYNYSSKQSAIMHKLLKRSQPKRNAIDNISIDKTVKRGPSIHTIRRMNVLNKIFMEYVTDFMSTGEIDPALANKSIELTDLKITQDFKQINISFIDISNDKSDTEEVLRRCALQLRHELTQLRIIGFVPPIQFLKCKHYDRVNEVEERLAIADYGEDYIPSLYPRIPNHVVTSKKTINKDNEAMESQDLDSPDDTFHISLPLMRHDVFGLDHYRIMTKIKSSSKQSQQSILVRTKRQSNVTSSSTNINIQPDFSTETNQREQFAEFIKTRQKEKRMKAKKFSNRNIDDLNEDIYDDFDDFNIANDDLVDTDNFDDVNDEYKN
ncbi:uncharacterized protein LOC128888413 [Hylaeus anthracinus]|uniref:uncharacterized protein LOC128888413 n=1 Tax=Hylaeus anthracinus TaxID=313031 RepID=UPI0023BA151E|nr:uncharacterized protein LOC128888413 [Hylaeus anthracinus]